MPGEEPAQEKDDGDMHDHLQRAIADEIASLQPKNAEEREHPERVDQVGQGFGGVIDLHDPTEMDLVQVRCLHDVRGFNQPLAAARRNEDSEDCGVKSDEQRIGAVGGDMDEEVGKPCRDAGADDHAEDDGVERKLDEDAAGSRHTLRNGAHEALRTPVEKQSDGEEHEVVGVEIERG